MPSTQVRVSEQMNNVTTILVQQRLDDTVLAGLDISQLNGNSNPGDALKAVLEAIGFRMSADGKQLWHCADARRVLKWKPTAASNSRKAAAGNSTQQRVAGSAGAHDAKHAARGSRWAVAAAADARPGAPLPIMRVPPAASARIAAGGSGWGNTARPLADCCLVELPCLDSLFLHGHAHGRACPSRTSCFASTRPRRRWTRSRPGRRPCPLHGGAHSGATSRAGRAREGRQVSCRRRASRSGGRTPGSARLAQRRRHARAGSPGSCAAAARRRAGSWEAEARGHLE